jgi:pyruvate/2-oxoglutarate dehydrogenase complex dihydrolipoamide dehydrogenase (E3) component
MSEPYDLVVIGTGSAAMAAGIEARSRGKSCSWSSTTSSAARV